MIVETLAALGAPKPAIDGYVEAKEFLDASGVFDTNLIGAHFLGQCAHESQNFSRLRESLYYSTPERLMAVWPSRFPDREFASMYIKDPEALANFVYAGRMGNGDTRSGDGFRFRGRGYIQITGRWNYERYGPMVGVDLIEDPDRAQESATAWKIAAAFFTTAKRGGKTCAELAAGNDYPNVTRCINGGVHGLESRKRLTRQALAALEDNHG